VHKSKAMPEQEQCQKQQRAAAPFSLQQSWHRDTTALPGCRAAGMPGCEWVRFLVGQSWAGMEWSGECEDADTPAIVCRRAL